MATQSLNVAYSSIPEFYVLNGRITNPGASFVLTAGAAPKFTVSRTGAGVYVVTLAEAPTLFLGADLLTEGVLSNNAAASVSSTTSYVYAPAVGSQKATVTFYTTANSAATGAFSTTLTDLPFCFQIFCADTNKVA